MFYHFKLARIAFKDLRKQEYFSGPSVCFLDPEMLVFLDESGFVSIQLLFYNFLYSSIIFHKSQFFRQPFTFLGQKTFLAPMAIV